MAKHNLNDREVADRIRRSRATVSRIRRKKIKQPEPSTLKLLSEFSAGEISANDFMLAEAAE